MFCAVVGVFSAGFCPASPTTGFSHPICYDHAYLPWLYETLPMISKLFRINGQILFNSYLPSVVVGNAMRQNPLHEYQQWRKTTAKNFYILLRKI
jgi:hypothetical protein